MAAVGFDRSGEDKRLPCRDLLLVVEARGKGREHEIVNPNTCGANYYSIYFRPYRIASVAFSPRDEETTRSRAKLAGFQIVYLYLLILCVQKGNFNLLS